MAVISTVSLFPHTRQAPGPEFVGYGLLLLSNRLAKAPLPLNDPLVDDPPLLNDALVV